MGIDGLVISLNGHGLFSDGQKESIKNIAVDIVLTILHYISQCCQGGAFGPLTTGVFYTHRYPIHH